jgi:outer membrane murein-binding lipoprotein Lpp
MRHVRFVLLVTACCLICSGCGSAKIAELTAQVEQLKASSEAMKAEHAAMQAELAKAKQDLAQAQQHAAMQAERLAQVEEIKKGYEDARVKFGASLKQLAPILGTTESPLPPFEGLKDSSWVGKFALPANPAPGMKELQNELQGLFGEGAKAPKP